MSLKFAAPSKDAIPVYLADTQSFQDVLQALPKHVQTWAEAQQFKGAFGSSVLCPDAQGKPELALLGLGDESARRRQRFCLAAAAASLPSGIYKLESDFPFQNKQYEVLGWLLLGYCFDKYKASKGKTIALVAPDWADVGRIEAMASAEALSRDLVNTPASDMGPDALADHAAQLAAEFDAAFEVIVGDDLLKRDFPMIHAVGRASATAPRLIDIRHGKTGPKVVLVGKGVCFDTGGLNLKPGGSMGLMKKDMGGAANVLGLAKMIMALQLPIQLRVLIPAVENSVSSASFRPQDILTSRKGLSVEINNTDAEGRLVLADALSYADEEDPDLVISMATLTGAARVALGPDLAPFYTSSDDVAAPLLKGGEASLDPVWRMPFWDPYETMIEPQIADLDNAPSGGFAGSITAALFLRRFVSKPERYVHFDIYSWNPTAKPARSKGGVGQGPRAILTALPDILGLK
ncbi:MAG: leucyl aminopeptidase family protein [Paracoccaceae bacterium]